jgi:hypothetical protein
VYVVLLETYTAVCCFSPETIMYRDNFVAEICLKLLHFCVTSLRCLKMGVELKTYVLVL